MGSSSVAQWKPPADQYIVMDYKYCRVWVRKSDKAEHLEEYPLRIQNDKQLQRYQNMFILRLEQPYFPASLYFINNGDSLLCSGGRTGSILIQRIPYRLCQFTNIPYPQSLSILHFALKGYQILHQKYGPFRIKSTMIGLDLLFKIKLWHHTDLSSPQPEDPYCQTVYDMIGSLVRSVENVAACPYDMPRFSEFLEIRKVELFGFQLAGEMVEEFAGQFHIKIENKFDLIQRYLKEAAGIMPTPNKALTMKSSSKLDFSTPEKSRNRSQNKFSFKNNKVIEVEEGSQQRLIQNSYYNTSILSPRQSSFVRQGIALRSHSSTKLATPSMELKTNLQPPLQEPRLNIRETKIRNSPPQQSFASIADYGLAPKQTPYFPTHTHTRAASKFEKISKQSTKQSSAYLAPQHGRAASDFTGVSKALPGKPALAGKPYSPYYDNTETKSGEDSSSRSFKTLISADSYSISVDGGQLKPDMLNMLKNKK